MELKEFTKDSYVFTTQMSRRLEELNADIYIDPYYSLQICKVDTFYKTLLVVISKIK